MTFQQIPQCVEVTLAARQHGTPVINRFYVRVGEAPTSEDLEDVADVVDAWITNHLAALHPTSFFYDTITVKDMHVANGSEFQLVPTTPHGTSVGTPVPNNAALVVSMRTALTGRNYRGRQYVGGLVTAYITDSTHVSEAAAASVLSIYQELLDAIETATFSLVVVSKWLNNALRVIADVHTVLTLIVNTTIDSQQRRTGN
jgi:hypothetical protein